VTLSGVCSGVTCLGQGTPFTPLQAKQASHAPTTTDNVPAPVETTKSCRWGEVWPGLHTPDGLCVMTQPDNKENRLQRPAQTLINFPICEKD